MSSKSFRRYVAVGTLAALASLAGANPVHARQAGTVERAWQWVQEAWRFSGLNLWNRTPIQNSARRTTEKGGWGLDPNGKPAPDPDPSALYCESCGDIGHGIDPNG